MVETGEATGQGSLFMPVRVVFRDLGPTVEDAEGWIKTKRRQLGWSQADLARRIGVNTATVKCWESGRQSPRVGNMAGLVDVLEEDPNPFGES